MSENNNLHTLTGVAFRWLPRIVQGTSFDEATFQSCSAHVRENPERRFTFDGATLTNCKHSGCNVCGAIIRNCVVSNITLAGHMPTFLWGCLYSNVTLKGTISGLLVRHQVNPLDENKNSLFLEHATKYYKSVRSALDISEASFSTIEALYGVPPELITRNPETQFILRKDMAKNLLESNGSAPALKVIAEILLDSSLQSVLFVLGQSDDDFDLQLQFATSLRARGILE